MNYSGLSKFKKKNKKQKKKTEDLLGENLGGFKVENVPGSHLKERNGKNKNGNTQICSCEGEGKGKEKSKDKDKQWSHSTGKKSQEENAKKYGDGENCWERVFE